MQLPEQPDPTTRRTADQLVAAVDEALLARQVTSYRDTTPLPAVGSTPPVQQPGQPAMSQWATDASGVLKAVGAASIPIGGALWIVGQIEPWALGIILGSPVIAALALARLVAKVKDANQAAPQPATNHYHGTVTQQAHITTTTTKGVIAKTQNR
ncbi:hypothetical protein AB0M89_13135 [Streptomyces microflavus]|uniref:hypothetical protein n=1 Tax=Streptomyces microflavus TaxID=1919 RepID=UPI0034240661